MSSHNVIDLCTNKLSKFLTINDNQKQQFKDNNQKKEIKKLISNEKSKKGQSLESWDSCLNSLLDESNSEKSDVSSDGSSGDYISMLCSNTLKDALQYKLISENIDLTSDPYSDSAGFCGIPPALIQRYTDECQRDIYEVSETLDALRMKALEKRGRRGIPNDYLGDSCVGPVIDMADYQSLHLWFISIGLPMYENYFKTFGFTNLYKISKLRETDIVNKYGIRDKRHVRLLTTAITALHLSLSEMNKT